MEAERNWGPGEGRRSRNASVVLGHGVRTLGELLGQWSIECVSCWLFDK